MSGIQNGWAVIPQPPAPQVQHVAPFGVLPRWGGPQPQHQLNAKCWCVPRVQQSMAGVIVVHNPVSVA